VRKLISALDQANVSMANHAGRGLPRLSEADTKRILIQPILAGLGWDVLTGKDLRMEYPIRTTHDGMPRHAGYVDYALFVRRRVMAVVEAKAFRNDLNDLDVLQAVRYAKLLGAKACLLTNGREFEMHYVHPDTNEAVLIGTAELGIDQVHHVADFLGRLAKDRIGELGAHPWQAPPDAPRRPAGHEDAIDHGDLFRRLDT
jgi:hypothetical protein